MNKEMFVHHKRPSKRMRERMRHTRAGGSTVLVTGSTYTANSEYESRCEMCNKAWHDVKTCQAISLIRIAEALEILAENKQ